MPEPTKSILTNAYEHKLSQIEKSDVIKETYIVLDKLVELTEIRCLGLGSISSSAQAMYQLCFLSLLKKHLESHGTGTELKVSLWDPVFSALEISFIEEELNYTVKEKETSPSKTTLYYTPHFPIDLLEGFITDNRPKYMLTNNLTVYTFKFTDSKYFELHPNCARITKLIADTKKNTELKGVSSEKGTPKEDGFEVVVKKKNRKNKNAYVPPVVDYDFDSAYFSSVEAIDIKEGNDMNHNWGASFTDLTYIDISTKD